MDTRVINWWHTKSIWRWSNASPSKTCWTSPVSPAMSGGKRVQTAFARTAFCGALGMSVSSKRADGYLHNSKRNNAFLSSMAMRLWNRSSGSTCIDCPSTSSEDFDWIIVTWSLRLNENLHHWNTRHRVHNLLSDFFRAAQINVTSRIWLPSRCSSEMCSQQTDLFQTLWEEGCECLSCHAVAKMYLSLLYVLFIGAVLGSTQLLHCSIYLSACRHSK